MTLICKITLLLVYNIMDLFHQVNSKLYETKAEYNWTDSLYVCTRGRIAIPGNYPNVSSLWRDVRFENRQFYWVGAYEYTSSFYWTAGGCYDDIPKDYSFEVVGNITMKKCIRHCDVRLGVTHVASQGVICFCMKDDPSVLLQNKCSPCFGNNNEKCGSPTNLSYFVYKKLNRNGLEIKELSGQLNYTSPRDCFSLFMSKQSEGNIEPRWELLKCSDKRPKFICQSGDNLKLFNSTMTWDNASKSCTDKNMTLAKLDKNDVDKREFKNLSLMEGNLYWIGLRRFLFRVELDDPGQLSFTPGTCLAITNRSGSLQIIKERCQQKAKVICTTDALNLSTQRTSRNKLTTTYSTSHSKNGSTNDTGNSGNAVAWNPQNDDNSGISSSNTSSDSSLSAGAVAGICIVVILMIIVIAVLLFIFLKRKFTRLKRTPSYREPHIEYSNKRKESEFSVLNDRSSDNTTKKVQTPPLKPARRTKSGNSSVRGGGIEYENIVLSFEDPKTLSKTVSVGSNAVRTSSTRDGKGEYSTVSTESDSKVVNGTRAISSEYGIRPEIGQSTSVYGVSDMTENTYDVMERTKVDAEDMNPNYDHVESSSDYIK